MDWTPGSWWLRRCWGHAEHVAARDLLARLLAAGDFIAIAPQVLAEFIHIVTDPRRFTQPLDLAAANRLAEQWWTAREVVACFPTTPPLGNSWVWLRQYFLGRKHSSIPFWRPLTSKPAFAPFLPRTLPISRFSAFSTASRQQDRHRSLEGNIPARAGPSCAFVTADDKLVKNLQGRFPFVVPLASMP